MSFCFIPVLHVFHLFTSFVFSALQMKGRWESNIYVWYRFMYTQKWNCPALLFPKHNYNVLSPSFPFHASVGDLYIPRIVLHILLQPNRQTDPGNTYRNRLEIPVYRIGNEATQFNSISWNTYIGFFGTVWFTTCVLLGYPPCQLLESSWLLKTFVALFLHFTSCFTCMKQKTMVKSPELTREIRIMQR
jgi:hypothetical protein